MDTHCDTSSKKEDFADILAVLVVIIKNEKQKVVMVAGLELPLENTWAQVLRLKVFKTVLNKKPPYLILPKLYCNIR